MVNKESQDYPGGLVADFSSHAAGGVISSLVREAKISFILIFRKFLKINPKQENHILKLMLSLFRYRHYLVLHIPTPDPPPPATQTVPPIPLPLPLQRIHGKSWEHSTSTVSSLKVPELLSQRNHETLNSRF